VLEKCIGYGKNSEQRKCNENINTIYEKLCGILPK
jgi:hypothetical protein